MRKSVRGGIVVGGVFLLLGVAMPALAKASGALELRQASMAWMRAIEAKDEAALQSFLAPEFRLVAPGERDATPRAEWLRNAVQRDWSGFRYEALEPIVTGDHAVVHSRLYFRVAPVPVQLDAGIVDTWVRREGRWQVTARYLGASRAIERFHFAAGLLGGLLAWALWTLARRLRRRRS